MAWVAKKHRSHILGKRIYSSKLLLKIIDWYIEKEKKIMAEFKNIEVEKNKG